MDVNTLRIAVTVAGLALFLALVVHTWSRSRRADHQDAAMLPFSESGDVDVPAAGGNANRTKE
ncbi:MAG: cbb3-type cytochrome c oxidase subunit 3 [Burkholderiaceae bacterium]|jgi:cbb3-type cytochrome oxidase subunit 3|nr:cbb3-type cytochrome c oxidase subunit 3 [Burkholderiaceae bacterium]MCZ8176900.1 cbb3-type cytochrome c oxidase subunit 3 [Burkholderiaceae bacterium]